MYTRENSSIFNLNNDHGYENITIWEMIQLQINNIKHILKKVGLKDYEKNINI